MPCQQYLANNTFLADINNEREVKNQTYKDNLVSLNNFVLIQYDYCHLGDVQCNQLCFRFRFEDDVTVVPKASEWFGYYEIGNVKSMLPMQQQPIYTEDWIGLQELDQAGKLVFLVCALPVLGHFFAALSIVV